MPRLPITLAVTAATFAGMGANDYPDGQQVRVTDDDQRTYEAVGVDGARTWVEVSGPVDQLHPFLLMGA